MNAPVLTFFNNKGGVGKTTLVYHVAAMFAEQGKTIVLLDLDPQANLTGSMIEENVLELLWEGELGGLTIFDCIKPLLKTGDIENPVLQKIRDRLYLVPGTLSLARFEDELSSNWNSSMGDKDLYRPFRVLTAFWQVAQLAAQQVNADLVVVDVGPNLGAINRSALIASDYVAIPLGADLFSLLGLENLGPSLREWRGSWKKRLENWKTPEFNLPQGHMRPLGYLVQQYSVRMSRPVKAYDRWVSKVPIIYREAVLAENISGQVSSVDDPYCLAMLKHYRSLIPISQEHRKPIFSLTSADGAIGAHQQSVLEAKADFAKLCKRLVEAMSSENMSIEQH